MVLIHVDFGPIPFHDVVVFILGYDFYSNLFLLFAASMYIVYIKSKTKSDIGEYRGEENIQSINKGTSKDT